MKKNIHPEYVETQVTCTCGNTFTTRSTAASGSIHSDVCSQCHPFYTGKQKILDTGGRVARFEKRYAKLPPRAPRRSSSSVDAGPASSGGRRDVFVRPSGPQFESEVGACSRQWTAWWPSTPSSSCGSPTPRSTPTRRLAKRLNQRYAELSADRPGLRRLAPPRRRPRGRPRARGRGRVLRRRGRAAHRAPRDRRGAAPAPAGPARRRRRQGRDAGDQVRRGRRGVRAVRRRPAADVHPLRRAARLADRGARRHRVRPRRLQVGHRRGQGQGHAGAGRGAVRAAEVRGRRAPRAAGAGHRVARAACTPPPPASW